MKHASFALRSDWDAHRLLTLCLKRQPESNLQDTVGRGSAADHAHARVADRVAGESELRMVKEVVGFAAELQPSRLSWRDAEAAMQTQVHIVPSRPDQNIAAFIAELIRRRRDEATCIEPLRKTRMLQRAATNAVGIRDGPGVRVIEREPHRVRQAALHLVDRADLPEAEDLAGPAVSQQRPPGAVRKIPEATEREPERDIVVGWAFLDFTAVSVLHRVTGAAAIAGVKGSILQVERAAVREAGKERNTTRKAFFEARGETLVHAAVPGREGLDGRDGVLRQRASRDHGAGTICQRLVPFRLSPEVDADIADIPGLPN